VIQQKNSTWSLILFQELALLTGSLTKKTPYNTTVLSPTCSFLLPNPGRLLPGRKTPSLPVTEAILAPEAQLRSPSDGLLPLPVRVLTPVSWLSDSGPAPKDGILRWRLPLCLLFTCTSHVTAHTYRSQRGRKCHQCHQACCPTQLPSGLCQSHQPSTDLTALLDEALPSAHHVGSTVSANSGRASSASSHPLCENRCSPGRAEPTSAPLPF